MSAGEFRGAPVLALLQTLARQFPVHVGGDRWIPPEHEFQRVRDVYDQFRQDPEPEPELRVHAHVSVQLRPSSRQSVRSSSAPHILNALPSTKAELKAEQTSPKKGVFPGSLKSAATQVIDLTDDEAPGSATASSTAPCECSPLAPSLVVIVNFIYRS